MIAKDFIPGMGSRSFAIMKGPDCFYGRVLPGIDLKMVLVRDSGV
jgi:hypothetical protein